MSCHLPFSFATLAPSSHFPCAVLSVAEHPGSQRGPDHTHPLSVFLFSHPWLLLLPLSQSVVIQSEMASFSVLHLWIAFVAQQLIACPFKRSSSFKIHALCTEALTQH